MKCDAVIFDLDGTLTDTLEDIADYMNTALAEYGFPVHPVDAYRLKVGSGMRTLVIRSLPEGEEREETVNGLEKRLIRLYAENPVGKTRLYPGIAELLDWLSRRGLPLSVLSNKAHELVVPVADALLSDWKFEYIRGASDSYPRKPEPDSALAIARDIGVEPGSVVFLGDSDIDMLTGNNAGMETVGALWGFRSRDELIRAGASRVISRPEELKEVIDGKG